MRIVTWNCQDALDKKGHVLEALSADVCVVQEATANVRFATLQGMTSIYGVPYSGAPKGTIVVARAPWTVSARPLIDGQPWVLPVQVRNDETGQTLEVFAIWTNIHAKDGRPGYAGQFTRLLDELQRRQPLFKTVVIGDLNSPVPGRSEKRHNKNIQLASEIGLLSLYHHATGCAHGGEPEMTLKWIGPGKKEWRYHCDFIFASTDLASRATCTIHPTFREAKPPSDHQPVVADLIV